MTFGNVSCWFLLVLLTVSCGDQTPARPDELLVKERGRKEVGELKMRLKGQLQEAMEAGGPLAAISLCKVSASDLTAANKDTGSGITLRRTSSRVRNPGNAPDATDRKVLEIFQTAKDSGSEFPAEHLEWLPNPKGTGEAAVYYQPLLIQPLCLNCHGEKEQMKPAVVELLGQLYPEDQATGYQAGNFRGLVRVDIPVLD